MRIIIPVLFTSQLSWASKIMQVTALRKLESSLEISNIISSTLLFSQEMGTNFCFGYSNADTFDTPDLARKYLFIAI